MSCVCVNLSIRAPGNAGWKKSDRWKEMSYDEFYNCNACHVCKTSTGPLVSCAGCRRYRYCCSAHRDTHAPSHADFCRAISNVVKQSRQTDWTLARLATKATLEAALHRPLSVAENQAWMFPRACVACHDPDNLNDCPRCPSVSFCSEEGHAEAHDPAACRLLSAQFEYYRRLMDEPFHPHRYPPVDVAHDTLVDDLMEIDDHRRMFYGDRLSNALTLYHAFKSTLFVPADRLTIHIVGAVSEYVNFDRMICELLLHWLKSVTTIHIVFIGPEVQKFDFDDWALCNACIKSKVQIKYEFHDCLYSKYFHSESFTLPHAIAVFNCGFHEHMNLSYDPWKATLPLLMIKGITLLITSYTAKEAKEDFRALKRAIKKDVEVDWVAVCERNRFCSPIPLRDWVTEVEFYYKNYFYSVLHVK